MYDGQYNNPQRRWESDDCITTTNALLTQTQRRPIIFLCHSLGGIVVKSVSPASARSLQAIVSRRLSLTDLPGPSLLRPSSSQAHGEEKVHQAFHRRDILHRHTTPRRRRHIPGASHLSGACIGPRRVHRQTTVKEPGKTFILATGLTRSVQLDQH